MSPKPIPRSPYPGPRPFQADEQPVFFGRDQESRELVSLLFAHRLTFLYAQSGAGKTSLLNAGVIPALKMEQFDVLPVVRVGVPTGQACKTDGNVFVWNTLAGWQEGTPKRDQTLAQYLEELGSILDEQQVPLPRVVIFDQFEEIFTSYPERWHEREVWFQQMADLLEQDQALRVVFVLREEFLASLDSCEGTLPERPATRYRLERLRQDAAVEAIEGPLKETKRKFAPGVAEALANKLLTIRTVASDGKIAEAPGEFIEPVQLQVVCRNLWDSLPSDVHEITESHLKDFGDVNEALMEFYENAIESVCRTGPTTEGELRTWFERTLLTPALTRGTVFRGATTTGGIPNSAVEHLEELHVVRGEMRAGAYWYELTHDRLVEPILQSNRAWRGRLSQAEQTLGFLENRAAQWVTASRQHKDLLNDLELAEAERWLNGPGGREAPEMVLMLITASREDRQRKEALQAQEQAREQAKIARRFRKMAICLGAATILAGASLALSVRLWIRAENNAKRAGQAEQAATRNAAKARDEERKAESARDLANRNFREMKDAKENADYFMHQAESEKQKALDNLLDANSQRDLAKRLAVELAAKAKLAEQGQAEAEELRRQAQDDAGNAVKLAAFASSRESAADAVPDLQLDPERSILLSLHAAYQTYGPYGTVTNRAADTLHRALQESRVRLSLDGHEDDVVSAVFSPDGRFIASGTYKHVARLWDAITGKQLRVFGGNDQEHVRGVAFTPDGRRLATATTDKVVKLWDVASGELVRTFSGHDDDVVEVAFNADGSLLVSAGLDNKAVLWDVESGRPLRRFEDNAAIRSVAFSPDGKSVATGSWAQSDNVRVWNVATGESKQPFSGHRGSIYSVAFSPDGRSLASASTDQTAKVWDTDTGAVKLTLSGHEKGVWSVAFSPDGTRLATASEDRTARLWDARTGNLLATMSGHVGEVRSVSFSPDGRRLVTGSFDKSVRVWDLTAGRDLPVVPAHKAVWSVAFSRDGKRIATGGDDGSVRLWDAVSGENLQELGGNQSFVTGVAFSPDDRRLASVSWGKTAKIWDLASGLAQVSLSGASLAKAAYSADGRFIAAANRDGSVEIWNAASGTTSILPDAADNAWGISISRDGKLLAAPGRDDTVKIWDFQAQHEKRSLTGSSGVWGVAFSPDGGLLAAGGVLEGPWIWDLRGQSGRPWLLPSPKGSSGTCIGVTFSPDGRRLAASCADGARIWTMVGRQLVLSLPHKGQVYDLAFSPDGQWLATGGADKVARIWDAASGKLVREFEGHSDFVLGVAFSPDGKLLVTASRDKTAILWDAFSGKKLHELKRHSDSVVGLAFNPQRHTELITSSLDGNVIIWDTRTAEPVKTFAQPVSSLKAVAFSPDGKTFATAGAEDHKARIWESVSGKMLRELTGHTDYVDSLAFSPDGRHLATASGDKTIRLWDAASGAVLQELKGHERAVVGVAFSPGGERIATASEDGTARIWDLASGKDIVRFAGHTGLLAAVAFSPDGKLVATGGEDKTVKIWRADTGEEVNSFSGPKGKISSLAFNGDGSRLAAASLDGTMRVYATRPEELIRLAQRRITRGFTEAECATHVHGDVGRCAALRQIAEGNRFARMGEVDQAAKAFQTAQESDSKLRFDSREEAQHLWAGSQREWKDTAVSGPINLSRQLVKLGRVTEAIQAYRDALNADSSLVMTANDANGLCWWGSLWGHAAEVIGYCEQALRLQPDNANYKDSRGLARALTGHLQEAVADFAAFIERTDDEGQRLQRRRWVEQITAGKNPFTPDEIQSLRRR